MSENVLELRGITKSYKGKLAVNNVDMTIPRGEIYGLIGKNGAGKTTLTRIITSLAHADSGTVELFGARSGKELLEARKFIGCVIETPSLYPNLSAFHNLEYYQRIKGVVSKSTIHKMLELVGLSDTGKKKFKDFSLGMKQRLGIALALLNNPDFLILDEPLNGLDPMGIIEMRELIKKLSTEHKITILISSHLLSELSLVATRYGIIDNGRMIKEFTNEELAVACQRCLAVRTTDLPKVVHTFETVLKTMSYKVVSENEVRLFDYLDAPDVVNRALVEADARVLSISEIGDNLEDYFMSLLKEANHHA